MVQWYVNAFSCTSVCQYTVRQKVAVLVCKFKITTLHNVRECMQVLAVWTRHSGVQANSKLFCEPVSQDTYS